MTGYRFTFQASRERFMEPTLHETLDYYVIADSHEQAYSHVLSMLYNGGWKIEEILTVEKIIIQDIRDKKAAEDGEAK